MRIRKLAAGFAAIGLPLTAAAMVAGTTVASASGTPITANGTITCTKLSGTIKFKPPLVNGGSASETTTATITESGCTDTATNLPAGTVVTGSVKSTLSSAGSTNSCASLATSEPESLAVKWSGKSGKSTVSIAGSTVSFSGYNVVANSKHDEGFQLPGNGSGGGGTSSVSGSFAGSDGGASSSALVYSTSTASTLAGDCAKKGIKTLTINKKGSTATVG